MSSPLLALEGRLDALPPAAQRVLFERGRALDEAVRTTVAQIIEDVGARGDEALRALALRYDGVALTAIEVARPAWDEARAALPGAVRAALEDAARAIAAFHRAQLPADLETEPQPGLRLGRRSEPLARVGVYAPGGRAAYPSSVLMGVVPARVAGVGEVVVCSPPGPDGLPPAAVLAAAAIGGADRVFALGGAGAIAAMALGTDTVPAVDRIVGPGNAYVTEAKQQLTRRVAIDCPAGPSELLVIADGDADADVIAAEVLAQAEHDPDACCVVVSTDAALLDAVRARMATRTASAPRRAIIERALAGSGALLLAADLDEALAFAARYAPEHLLLLTREPRTLLPRVRAAGTVFLGAASSVAFGDYMTGANHVLPTAGLARAYAGLSINDFLRFSTWQELAPEAAAALAPATAALAEAEGLPAHAAAARLRAPASPTPAARPGAGATIPAARAEAAAAASSDGARRLPPVLRPEYRALTVYDPGRTPCAVDLSDNTNLWGPHPAAVAAVQGAPDPVLTRYPDVYVPELKRRVAGLLGVAPENVTTACGSDDVIDSALRAFCAPGDTVAYPDPTFGMVPAFARMNVARPVPVPLAGDLTLDVAGLLAQQAAVTYVCRPNNPTGTLFDRTALDALERAARGVLLVDEAYIDFSGEAGLAQAAATSARTIVLRTFSKAYGLAGLRVGLAVGPAELIAEIEKSRGPYKVAGVAERAALAVLAAQDWVAARADDAIASRARLAEGLAALGLRTFPSAANFLLVALPPGADAAGWNRQLRARGVAIRPFPALPVVGECVRITVGPWPMMERALGALEDVLQTAHVEESAR